VGGFTERRKCFDCVANRCYAARSRVSIQIKINQLYQGEEIQ
jgi:hypothetical protein